MDSGQDTRADACEEVARTHSHYLLNSDNEEVRMNDSVQKQIAELQDLTYEELKERWAVLCGGVPPAFNRTFITKRLAYRIQELAYGGLPEVTRERMRQILLANGFNEVGCRSEGKHTTVDQSGANLPVLGTKLSREWNGTRYEATVVHGGFEYEGKRYRSLTAVTKAITGTHWNGRAFFGIKPVKGGKR